MEEKRPPPHLGSVYGAVGKLRLEGFEVKGELPKFNKNVGYEQMGVPLHQQLDSRERHQQQRSSRYITCRCGHLKTGHHVGCRVNGCLCQRSFSDGIEIL